MKKTRWMTVGLLTATIGLAGCNNETIEDGQGENGSKQLSNTELLKKASSAQENIKSFHMDSDMMSEVGGMPISQKISADIIQKPMTMYQKMTMKNAEDGTDVETELYLVDDKMYMSQSGQWLVQDTSELGDMLENMESSASTEQSLKLLKKYKDNWTMKKEGDVYQIDVDLKGDQLKAFMKDSLEQSGQLAQMKEVMDQVDYKKMEYSMTYDAKTYYPKTLDMEMAFEIEEGTEFTMKNESVFSKFNEIKSIELPAEAKDAQELPSSKQ
ncbi:LppX_LprAFG lipoprotein [Exiguobacterium sp. Helios]|uniref:DUF6612 family protein n=1 Tax=unclassified Exiguobacterium TaxID=2644629 RepID=UPI00165E788A|nr:MULTISPECIES: DUF6612 family protein [unclassified Exiguobacterium]QNR22240.1 LppX_LprAFG lipoprotein [Exiguobacterium sp. Helios]